MALAPKTRELAKRSGKFLEEALYRRLFREGNSPASVRNQLEEFLKSRKRVHKWEVGATIRRLRDHKLFRPALKKYFQIWPLTCSISSVNSVANLLGNPTHFVVPELVGYHVEFGELPGRFGEAIPVLSILEFSHDYSRNQQVLCFA